jgi:hypothetical protein
MTDDQQMQFGRAHLDLTEQLAATGELIVSEGLADPATAKRISVRDGRTMTTDGPFAEVKEYLAGFYLVDCESLDRAVELASVLPDAANGGIEVRPVLDMSGWEL